MLLLMIVVVVVARAIRINGPYVYGASNRERHCTNENKNPSLHLVVRLL
jgi:hypothetical protein